MNVYLVYGDILEEAAQLVDVRRKWTQPIQTAVAHGFAGPLLSYFRVRTSSWASELFWENACFFRDVECGPGCEETMRGVLGCG